MKYEIRYGNRKTISISVKRDARIVVNAPRGISEKQVRDVLEKHAEWIEKAINKVGRKKDEYATLSLERIKELHEEARKYFTDKTGYFSKIMGLKYGRITITSAKTRFGSCSSKGNISYSLYLMLKDESLRDYVVVHELAHLVYMNHSKEFYSLVEKYMPDYKERRKLLKE